MEAAGTVGRKVIINILSGAIVIGIYMLLEYLEWMPDMSIYWLALLFVFGVNVVNGGFEVIFAHRASGRKARRERIGASVEELVPSMLISALLVYLVETANLNAETFDFIGDPLSEKMFVFVCIGLGTFVCFLTDLVMGGSD